MLTADTVREDLRFITATEEDPEWNRILLAYSLAVVNAVAARKVDDPAAVCQALVDFLTSSRKATVLGLDAVRVLRRAARGEGPFPYGWDEAEARRPK